MDTHIARTNMIKQQLHTWNVFDDTLLQLFADIPREAFVPSDYQALAYADMAIPLGHGQQMFTPKEEGRLLQALAIQPSDIVLEIGTGSGFLTALLAQLANEVFSVDIFEEFIEQANAKLLQYGCHNATVSTADAAEGWGQQAPYDVIVVTGSTPLYPKLIANDLRVGGKMFVIVGQAPAMTACLITRKERHTWEKETLFETVTPALINAPEPNKFQF